MSSEEKQPISLAVPLVVGVTGHRDLHDDDTQKIRECVQKFFDDLERLYPHTPILVLSALVGGADRLVAEEILNRKGGLITLAAVLPWARGINDEGLIRGGDESEFWQLVESANQIICLPYPEDSGEGELGTSEGEERQFDQMGRYIAAQSQVMLALWNGEDREGSSTWRVIQWQQQGAPAIFDSGRELLDEPETGPVYHLKVRRSGEKASSDCFSLTELALTKYANVFPEMVKRLDAFNKDVGDLGSDDEADLQVSQGYVLPEDKREKLPAGTTFLLERYAAADVLAQRYQKWARKSLIGFFVLIFVMIVAFEAYAHVSPTALWLILGYLFVLVSGFAGARMVSKLGIHQKYLSYRALAEALRIQVFWNVAGIRNCVSDHYLRSFRSELDWIRSAVRSWGLQSGAHDCSSCKAMTSKTSYPIVQAHWVDDQLGFFRKNAGRNHCQHERLHGIARCLLGASVAVVIFQIFRLVTDCQSHVGHHGDHLTHYIIVVIALLLVLGGILHEYGEKMALKKQARSYEQMSGLFGVASSRLQKFIGEEDWDSAETLLVELGREALAENADWVLYHRERPPEMKAH